MFGPIAVLCFLQFCAEFAKLVGIRLRAGRIARTRLAKCAGKIRHRVRIEILGLPRLKLGCGLPVAAFDRVARVARGDPVRDRRTGRP